MTFLPTEATLVGFGAATDGGWHLTFAVPGSPHLLRLAVARGRSRFWAVDPEGFLDDVALPRPELWGFLPSGTDPVEVARVLRAVSRRLIERHERTGEVPGTQEPPAPSGPSYLSPGA